MTRSERSVISKHGIAAGEPACCASPGAGKRSEWPCRFAELQPETGNSKRNPRGAEYTPAGPLEEIDANLKKAEEEILRLLREVTE